MTIRIPLKMVPLRRQRLFNVDGLTVLVWRSGAACYAIENKCPHAGFPLEGGEIADNIIRCPVHGARFDMRDGSCTTNPSLPKAIVFDAKMVKEELVISARKFSD